VIRGGRFDITVLFVIGPPGVARVEFPGLELRGEVGPGSRTCRFEGVELKPGPGRLRAWVERPNGGVGAFQIEFRRRE